jgi:hypothetical protein
MSVFTRFLFKALAVCPGVSTVLPVIRVGSVLSLRFSVYFSLPKTSRRISLLDWYSQSPAPALYSRAYKEMLGRVVYGNP